MSDVPLGAMLSGGLDSSLIVALMARHDDRAGEDVRGRLLRGGRRQRARRRAASSPRRSAPTTTSSSSRFAQETIVDLADLVWHLDEPLADLSVARLPSPCPSWRAKHVTVALSGQGADELLGGYRKHRAAVARRHAGSAFPRRSAKAILARRARTARRACGGRSTRSRRPDPAERLLAMSGELDPALRERARARPARGARRQRGAPRDLVPARRRRRRRRCRRRSTWTGSSGSPTTCSTTSTAPRWRTRSRCASRSSTTSSSSSARRCPPSLKVRRLDDEARPQARGARPRPRPDHRQAEDRLLQLGRRRLVPRADARRDHRLPARSRRRATREMLDRGAVERLGQEPRRPERPGNGYAAALDPDARGLARGRTCRALARRHGGARENRRLRCARTR